MLLMKVGKGFVRSTLLLAAVAFLASPPLALSLEARPYRVIVNASSSLETIERLELIRVFLGQTTRWEDGTRVRPVDLSLTSAVRKDFSNAVLGQSLVSVKNYWQQQIFSGRAAPPPVKETEAEVLAFIATSEGAIGYVSANVELPPGVRAITTSE